MANHAFEKRVNFMIPLHCKHTLCCWRQSINWVLYVLRREGIILLSIYGAFTSVQSDIRPSIVESEVTRWFFFPMAKATFYGKKHVQSMYFNCLTERFSKKAEERTFWSSLMWKDLYFSSSRRKSIILLHCAKWIFFATCVNIEENTTSNS